MNSQFMSCICMYNQEGKFLSKRCFSCRGCALKRMPKNVPACIREENEHGKIIKMNEYFKRIEKKVK